MDETVRFLVAIVCVIAAAVATTVAVHDLTRPQVLQQTAHVPAGLAVLFFGVAMVVCAVPSAS